MTVSLADRGRYWCSVDTGGAAETQGDTLEYSLTLEVSSLLNKIEYLKFSLGTSSLGLHIMSQTESIKN